MDYRRASLDGSEPCEPPEPRRQATLTLVPPDWDHVASDYQADPIVVEVLAFENLPRGEMASQRVLVLWSDGSQGEALRWYDDEVLVCEGDLIGKTQDELRSLHFRRDRDWLQS